MQMWWGRARNANHLGRQAIAENQNKSPRKLRKASKMKTRQQQIPQPPLRLVPRKRHKNLPRATRTCIRIVDRTENTLKPFEKHPLPVPPTLPLRKRSKNHPYPRRGLLRRKSASPLSTLTVRSDTVVGSLGQPQKPSLSPLTWSNLS